MSKELIEAAEQFESAKNAVKPLYIKTGEATSFVVLPDKDEPTKYLWFKEAFVHFGYKDPKTGKPASVRCLGRGCPMCADVSSMYKRKSHKAREFARKPQYLYYVASDYGLNYIAVSETIHQKINDEIMGHMKAGLSPLTPEEKPFLMTVRKAKRESDGKTDWIMEAKISSGTVRGLKKALERLSEAPALIEQGLFLTLSELDAQINGPAVISKQEKKTVSTLDTQTRYEPSSVVMSLNSDEDDTSSLSDEELQASIFKGR